MIPVCKFNPKKFKWAKKRPVVDKKKCVGCGTCARYCPEGAIKIINGKAEIDYNYCKGCGICAEECPFKAIMMSNPVAEDDEQGGG